ncbi:MAG: glycosyltransferase [Candidatus Kapabacteria bacterium]|nr:glycosyltransferase [Ignavibacteriota bacterium]MCW5884361.1 glycosyltransferase [Candidatus Kapabacteria bacterium]
MVWIIVVSVVIFTLRALVMFIGSSLERSKVLKKSVADNIKTVSVIVPARNEEDKIESCIRNLSKCNYPLDKFEIIAINDRSEDKTGEILDILASEITNLKVLHIKSDIDKGNLKGKPGALHFGIKQSKGEIIMMTDADCTVNPNWIRTISDKFNDEKIGLVPSYTLIDGERYFDKIQAVEWLYMHTMASAGIGLNNPLGCYGNNLSIRKTVYDELGGYPKIKFSVTEDLALLKAVFKAGHKVNYVCDYNASVTTLPCLNIKEYISQHKRWAVGGLDLGINAVIFPLTSLAVWAGLIVGIVAFNPLWILAVLFARVIGDYIVIKPAMNILRQNHVNSWILPAIGFFMLMELIVPPLLIDSKIVWKGQVFNKKS